MRCLRRNKQAFYYAVIASSGIGYNEDGLETGGREITYTNPVYAKANISSAKNVDVVAVFGTELKYDKVLALEDAPFDENALLWIDTLPVLNDDGSTDTPPDYVVKRIAKSLNSVMIAVSKVNVRYG